MSLTFNWGNLYSTGKSDNIQARHTNSDGHETLKPKTETRPRHSPAESETRPRCWPHQSRRDRDVPISRRDRDEMFVGHETSPKR